MSEMDDLPTNWGRWGERDERGTLNLITDEVRARAVAEARTGRTVSISRPMPASPLVAGPTAPLGADSIGVLQAALFTGVPPRGTAELVVMMTHSPEVTHFDALAHQVVDGRVGTVVCSACSEQHKSVLACIIVWCRYRTGCR